MAPAMLIKSRRRDILRIAAKHGAVNVRVFGSAARDEMGPDSDIDLLVDVAENHSPWFPGSLVAELEQVLGRRVDVVESDGLHWYVRDKVLSEAVQL